MLQIKLMMNLKKWALKRNGFEIKDKNTIKHAR